MFIRRNLAQNPDAFVRNPIVAQELKRQGINALPITLVDGQLVKPVNTQPLTSLAVT